MRCDISPTPPTRIFEYICSYGNSKTYSGWPYWVDTYLICYSWFAEDMMMMLMMIYDVDGWRWWNYDILWGTTMWHDILKCITKRYDVLRCTTMYCDVLRCSTMYYDVLRCTTVYYDDYNVLPCTNYNVIRWSTYYDVVWCTSAGLQSWKAGCRSAVQLECNEQKGPKRPGLGPHPREPKHSSKQ